MVQQGAHGGRRLTTGSRVLIRGMRSAKELNNQPAMIRGFDQKSGRYVVQSLLGGPPHKVTAEHLFPLDNSGEQDSPSSGEGEATQEGQGAEENSAEQDQGEGPAHIPKGAKVFLFGLHKLNALNGKSGTIRGFDDDSGRYIVELPGIRPKKIKAENLQFGPRKSPDKVSLCQRQIGATSELGPSNLRSGAKVTVHGLKSPAATKGHWNGMVATVHCFDKTTGRYVVAMPDGAPRKIKGVNLVPLGSASFLKGEGGALKEGNYPKDAQKVIAQLERQLAKANAALGKATLAKKPAAATRRLAGSKARLVGLKAAALLNDMVATIKGFDNTTQRYVVQIPDGTLKRVKSAHLADLVVPDASSATSTGDGTDTDAAVPAVVQPHVATATQPRMSVCNGYAKHSPLQVFAISPDGSQYNEVVNGLAFQSCTDVKDFPVDAGSLSFVIDRLQVARVACNGTILGPTRGLELVVYRNDVNSLKAKVHQNIMEISETKFYHLNIVNAYAGGKLLELKVKRGNFDEQLALDKTYRLNKAQPIQLSLSDGFQKLNLGFDPQMARTYTVVLTGVDMGLRGEPRNVGLVAHEAGGWTSFEEMSGSDGPPPVPLTPPVLFAPTEDDAPKEIPKRGVSWLVQRAKAAVTGFLQKS